MNFSLKRFYYQSCCEELRVLKPGNHSFQSKILGMDHKKFELGAKISSEILSDNNLKLGEAIYLAATKCFKELRSNYNLGIILLCAPIFKIPKNKYFNLRVELTKIINEIPETQGKLILNAIREVGPAGIKKYSGKGNIYSKSYLKFSEIMKVGANWDRISRSYTNNYKEIFTDGLPYLTLSLKRFNYNRSISSLFLNFLSLDYDSHILRKYGIEKAAKVQRKAALLKNIKSRKKLSISLQKFDKYLKFLNLNPGTCADLTVTTLLISKIRDIFKFQI